MSSGWTDRAESRGQPLKRGAWACAAPGFSIACLFFVFFLSSWPGLLVAEETARVGFSAAETARVSFSAAETARVGFSAAEAARVSFSAAERSRILEHSPLGLPPADPSNAVADSDGAARLGQQLFFEKRLSSGDIACSSCHIAAHGLSDGKSLSEGIRKGRRRTQSLWNVAYNRWFFWDGRRDSLWAQSLAPIESDGEMGGTRLQAVHLVRSDAGLRGAYEAVFGPLPNFADPARFPITGRPVPDDPKDPRGAAWREMSPEDRAAVDRVYANLGKAIEAYERRLLSRHSPFDRFVADLRAGRESDALAEPALRGLKLFVGRGNCRVCHGGPNFTDEEFHNIGVPALAGGPGPDPGRYGGIDAVLGDPFNRLGPYADAAAGADEKLRYVRRSPENWGQVKTPSLRNVAVRSPYMHQGQFATLREVVRFYSTRDGATPAGPDQERILVPLKLSPGETDDLLAFLDSLTDESIDPSLLAPPAAARSLAILPASAPATTPAP